MIDYVIGNPPYQDEQISQDAEGSLKNYQPPVYNQFMDAAYEVGEKVELIHPARFLFNAGSTPKVWNDKMLNDEHFKVMYYDAQSSNIFPNTDIKGGIVITYRSENDNFGAIKTFSPYTEINSMFKKVIYTKGYTSIDDIVFSRTSFRLTPKVHDDYPDAKYKLSDGHLYDMSSNILQRLPFLFYDDIPSDGNSYSIIIGRENNKRVLKYIRTDYITKGKNLDAYKLFIPQAYGNGFFGEAIGTMIIGKPNMAATETFLSIGNFNSQDSVYNLELYLKTKFARSLISILKVTQIGNKPVYKYVPLQDFTSSSDIDWSASIANIDKQLYKKYGLSKEEIDFIETHVKEME